MNRAEPTTRRRRGPAALVATLLLALVALAAAAQPAAAVSAIGVALAEDWANTYAMQQCRQDGPECDDGWAGRCRQEGRFQVTCYLYKGYEIEPKKEFRELWHCHRRIRYTAEKRAYYKQDRLVTHRQFLGPWACDPHDKVNDNWFGPEEEWTY